MPHSLRSPNAYRWLLSCVLTLACAAAHCAAQPPDPAATPAPAVSTPNPSAEQPQTAPTPAAAQPSAQPTAAQPSVPYTIRTNVPLVVLDVVVTDAKGTPIRNLPRESFHVRESGFTVRVTASGRIGAVEMALNQPPARP